MAIIEIDSIERAINVWRSKSPARGEEFSLCREARILADVYALMIAHRFTGIDPALLAAGHIDSSLLTPEQQAAYDAAFTS